MTARRSPQGLLGAVKPYVPVPAKRVVRRLVPERYHALFDPDWHRRTIGNLELWDELGQLQLDFLVEQGLEPGHRLLDVGCGPLRAGAHFIRYLETGRYFGVDKNEAVLEQARRELDGDLAAKRPTVRAMADFELGTLGQRFDYALAQSVFTHLPLNRIIRCLMEMEEALVPGGRFYATFFENPEGKRNLEDVRQTDTVITHFDRDFYHYDFGTFAWICDGTRLAAEYVGDWGNPRNQKMLCFTRL